MMTLKCFPKIGEILNYVFFNLQILWFCSGRMVALNYIRSANITMSITHTWRTSRNFPSCAAGLVGTVPAAVLSSLCRLFCHRDPSDGTPAEQGMSGGIPSLCLSIPGSLFNISGKLKLWYPQRAFIFIHECVYILIIISNRVKIAFKHMVLQKSAHLSQILARDVQM